MEKALIHKLIDEVTQDVFDKNKEVLEAAGNSAGDLQAAVRLSAMTTVKILEKLELI